MTSVCGSAVAFRFRLIVVVEVSDVLDDLLIFFEDIGVGKAFVLDEFEVVLAIVRMMRSMIEV